MTSEIPVTDTDEGFVVRDPDDIEIRIQIDPSDL